MTGRQIPYLKRVEEFRRVLHQYPDPSGGEDRTAARVLDFCAPFRPDSVIRPIGGSGVALVFEGKRPGKTLMLRADLDALPIGERLNIPHRSRHKGIAHKCGHDGHMAILCGVASMLGEQRPERGRVVLLFQPEEETGRGAAAVLKDPAFQQVVPDRVFALHNLPGFPAGSVVVRNGHFAFASVGFHMRLTGSSSHAAFPEQGRSPLPLLINLLQELPKLPRKLGGLHASTGLTIIYSRLGQPAYGTSPGEAELAATVRSPENRDLKRIRAELARMIRELDNQQDLDIRIRWHEPFPATVNDPGAAEQVRSAARTLKLPLVEPDEPFRWSEDFGAFTAKFPGAMFGLGAGELHPALHSPQYDFPDGVIEPGVRIFSKLINEING